MIRILKSSTALDVMAESKAKEMSRILKAWCWAAPFGCASSDWPRDTLLFLRSASGLCNPSAATSQPQPSWAIEMPYPHNKTVNSSVRLALGKVMFRRQPVRNCQTQASWSCPAATHPIRYAQSACFKDSSIAIFACTMSLSLGLGRLATLLGSRRVVWG